MRDFATVLLATSILLAGCTDLSPGGNPAPPANNDPDPRPDAGMEDASEDVESDTAPDTVEDVEPECTPEPEICDEADNDCDGDIDEGFDLDNDTDHCGACGVVCDLENAGAACEDGGCVIAACAEGFEDADNDPSNGCEALECTPDPNGEVCDGADNDCDGEVDEDFDLDTNADHCGACGVVCELENAGAACEGGGCVIAACEEGFFDLNEDPDDGCEYLCEAIDRGEQEIACDGQDNDCNGMIDDGTEEGAACALGEQAEGVLTCTEGALICVPDGDETPLCGPLTGVLSAEGSPYVITCEDVTVPRGDALTVSPGVEIRSGLDGPARIIVQGRLASTDAVWTGVGIRVEGELALVNDALTADPSGQTLIDIPDASEAIVDAVGVVLSGADGPALGLRVDGRAAEGDFSWDSGRFEGLSTGLRASGNGPLAFDGAIFEENIVGVEVRGAVALALNGGRIVNQSGPDAAGIVLGERIDGASVALNDLVFEQRSGDAAVELEAPQVTILGGSARHEGPERSTVHVLGDVEVDSRLVAFGELDTFSFPEEATVESGATLTVDATATAQSLDSGALRVEGVLDATGARLLDLPLTVADGGRAVLENAGVAPREDTALVGCLITLASGSQIEADGLIADGIEGLDGVCMIGAPDLSGLPGATVRGFGRGVVATNADPTLVVGGVVLEDNDIALMVEGAAVPIIEGNTFRSTGDHQMISIRFSVGAAPGGRVSGNTFDFDIADNAYHLDPDNFADVAGTTFGPNTFVRHQPSGVLISGALSSPSATFRGVTEVGPPDNFFLPIQVIGTLTVEADASLVVEPEGQVISIEGILSPEDAVALRVEGALRLQGPGILVNNLPVVFEAGATGTVARSELSGARTDLPLITLDDAEPVIGGIGSIDANILTGSNNRDMVGMLIRASSPMCGSPAALCPFVASNRFLTLAIGIVIEAPADFEGVNDFDDANPNVDSVPINVERR